MGEQGGEEGAALAMGGQVCLWGSMGTQERCCSSWKRANRRVEGRRQRVRALYSCARVQRFDGLVETIAKLNETASGSGGEIQAYDEPDSEFFDCQEGAEQAAVGSVEPVAVGASAARQWDSVKGSSSPIRAGN